MCFVKGGENQRFYCWKFLFTKNMGVSQTGYCLATKFKENSRADIWNAYWICLMLWIERSLMLSKASRARKTLMFGEPPYFIKRYNFQCIGLLKKPSQHTCVLRANYVQSSDGRNVYQPSGQCSNADKERHTNFSISIDLSVRVTAAHAIDRLNKQR